MYLHVSNEFPENSFPFSSPKSICSIFAPIAQTLNILITTQFGGIAGSTYSIFYLASGLAQRGHKVILGIPENMLLYQMARDHGLPVEAISFRSRFHIPSMRKIQRLVKREHIHLINPQESKDRYNVIFSRIFLGVSSKIILTRRQRVGDNNPLKRWLHVRFSDKIVVISHGLQKLVERKGFPINHTHVIYNGLPTEQYVLNRERVDQLKARYGISKDDVVIGAVARPKRQDQIVKALEQLPESWKVLFVGISKADYKKKFSSPGSAEERIIFAGKITDKSEVLHHYALMTVHVLSSQMDGFGLVLLEAMAMGVPVIGSRYGGIPDVIEEGVSGLIFDNGNIDELARHIRRVVEDDPFRAKLIANGAKRALNDFSIAATVSNYESFFEQMIAS